MRKNIKKLAASIGGVLFLVLVLLPQISFAEIKAPKNVKAVAGDGEVTVTFDSAVTTAGEVVTNYTAYTGGSDIYGISYYYEKTGPGNSIIVPVANSTTYKFKVYASGKAGSGPDSAFSNSVTPKAGLGSSNPTITSSHKVNGTSVTITGVVKGFKTGTSLDIAYGLKDDATSVTSKIFAYDANGNFSFDIGPLAPGEYHYQMGPVGTPDWYADGDFTIASPTKDEGGGGVVSKDDPTVSETDTPAKDLNIHVRYKNPLESETIPELLGKIIDSAVLLLTPLVVLMIIWTGFLFLKARGNAEALDGAKKALLYTLIGAAVVLVAKGFSLALKSIFSQL